MAGPRRGPSLAIVLLIAVPCVIFVVVLFILSSGDDPTSKQLRVNSIADATSIPTVSLDVMDHLVIVPGHAVMNVKHLSVAHSLDEAWYLLPYQRNHGLPNCIVSHIRRAADVVRWDARAVLVFSGGQTRRDVGPVSEALSYYLLAKEKSLISLQMLKQRVFLEEFARDSFENVLFSICRFREVTGRYPSKITVVGFSFKMQRFVDLHREAIRFPEEAFNYISLSPPTPPFNMEEALAGERRVVKAFEEDLYGCAEHTLFDKRMTRNPFVRSHPYRSSSPEIAPLLDWCGPALFQRALPWTV